MQFLSLVAAFSVGPIWQGQPTTPAQPEKNPFATTQDKGDEAFQAAVKDYAAQKGVFNVFTKGESIMFEIPPALLGRDFLWVAELKETASGGYNGSAAGEKVLRWEMRGEKLLLRDISYRVRATSGGAIKVAVEQSNVNPIIAAFDLKAKSKEGNILVDVTRLYKSDIPELSFRGAVGGGSMDSSRSFLQKAVAFPDNINVEVLATYTGGAAPGGGGGRGNPFGGGAPSRPSTTVVTHQSLTLLPEKPMMGRLADSRLGYFSTDIEDYGTEYQGVKEYAFINRYRLEKKDPSAALSEPKKPIVYYMSREIPEKWLPYVKAGVEDWQVAFEAAGFKNAIICKPAPTEKEDPNWSPEDARYSVIRWAPLPIENAMGPSTVDPRSGEIINAHIIMWHNVLKLGIDWYFAQAAAADKRAQRLPFPDDLTGEILRFVVAHEVGHTLGLQHNGKSSGMVPVKNLRDAAWTKANGTAGSIMDYARFNYVAQPGDGANLFPLVGPYDKFAIKWGYQQVSGAYNPSDETRILDALAAEQVRNPLLRFYDNFNSYDPTSMSEALGDDAVNASTYGVKNLQRIMGFVQPASTKLGEDYSELERLYGAVFGQYSLYVSHVTQMVGGVIQTDYRAGRGGDVFVPLEKSRQKAAVGWLMANVIETPNWLVPKSILAKLAPTGAQNRILAAQNRVFNGLWNQARISRMLDNEINNGSSAYSVAEMLADVRKSVWRELGDASPKISVYRRAMQRAYVSSTIGRLATPTSELRGYAFSELQMQRAAIKAASAKTTDPITKQHLGDLALMINQAFAFPPPVAPAPATQTIPFPFADEPEHYGCWSQPSWLRHDH